MSFYNLMNGVSPATFFMLPMIGMHPIEIPRFRNVFLRDEEHPEYDDNIQVYTRVGGNNRNSGYGEEKLEKHPNFVATFDDNFDNTYGTYVFSVPEEWKGDYDKIVKAEFHNLSEGYKVRFGEIYLELKDDFLEFLKEIEVKQKKREEEEPKEEK